MNYNKMTPKMALNLAAPHTWAASIMPSVFGVVYCYFRGYNLPVLSAIFLVLACVLMQSSVNTLNDYIDFVKGTDKKTDNLERSDAVLLYENINPKAALALSLLYLALAVLMGAYLIYKCGSLIPLYIGLIGVACVLLYSAGRAPISYLPIGELISGFVMGGLIPLGCVAVATSELHYEVLILALPFIISIGLIMMTNNGCDIEKDKAANRKTLPVLLGRERTKKLYNALIYIWMPLLWLFPWLLMGSFGLICPVLMHFFARPIMFWLLASSLSPEDRILQMKGILQANIRANSCYIITLLIGAILTK